MSRLKAVFSVALSFSLLFSAGSSAVMAEGLPATWEMEEEEDVYAEETGAIPSAETGSSPLAEPDSMSSEEMMTESSERSEDILPEASGGGSLAGLDDGAILPSDWSDEGMDAGEQSSMSASGGTAAAEEQGSTFSVDSAAAGLAPVSGLSGESDQSVYGASVQEAQNVQTGLDGQPVPYQLPAGECLLYEVPLISTECSLDSLVFVGYEDKYFIRVEDLAALTRCSISYTNSKAGNAGQTSTSADSKYASPSPVTPNNPSAVTLKRGVFSYEISASSDADIPCVSYNNTLYCEAVPAIGYLGGSSIISEDIPYLIVTMPVTTLEEVLLPDMGSYNYSVGTLYGEEWKQAVSLGLDYLAGLMNPFSGHTIVDSEKAYIKDALKTLLDVDITKYPSVSSFYAEENRKFADILAEDDFISNAASFSKNVFDTASGVFSALLDGLNGKMEWSAYVTSVNKMHAGNYEGWYQEIHKVQDDFINVYRPTKTNIGIADIESGFLDAFLVGLDIAVTTYQMASYGEDAQALFKNALDGDLLKAIGMENDLYWKDTANALSREINADVVSISKIETISKFKKFLEEQGLDSLAGAAEFLASKNGIVFASKVAGAVNGLLFNKEFKAYSADMNASFLNEFQQNTLIMLEKLAETFDEEWMSVKHQEQLKALLTLYYREIIAFSENMKMVNAEFGYNDGGAWQKQFSSDADRAALYLYRLASFTPQERHEYAYYKDRLLTAEWMEPFLLKVWNNGGEVIRYRDTTYYWVYNSSSVERDGLFGYFPYVEGTYNQLMARDEQGNETVLIRAPGYGNLYLAGNKIYYMEKYGQWSSVTLDGARNESLGSSISLLAVDSISGAVICQDINRSMIFCRDSKGSEWDIFSPYTQDTSGGILDLKDGILYYYEYNYKTLIMTVSGFNVSTHRSVTIGGINLVNMEFTTGLVFTGKVWKDDIYISYLPLQGTGTFYYNGCIESISLKEHSGWQLVTDNGPYPQMYEDFYFTTEGDTDYLYYYSGEGATAIGSGIDPWFSEGVMRLNLTTKRVESTGSPWIQYGSYAYMDGRVVTRVSENSPELSTVATASLLATLGYSDLNNISDSVEHSYKLANFNLVKDRAWFEVVEIVQDDSRSMGWRQGYARIRTDVYTTVVGTDEITLLYTY